MGFLGRAVDKNVIKKHQYELAQIRLEDTIHEGLKGGRGIGEAKRHYHELIMPLVSPEGGFMLISFPHPDLMIAGCQIKFGENCCSS